MLFCLGFTSVQVVSNSMVLIKSVSMYVCGDFAEHRNKMFSVNRVCVFSETFLATNISLSPWTQLIPPDVVSASGGQRGVWWLQGAGNRAKGRLL